MLYQHTWQVYVVALYDKDQEESPLGLLGDKPLVTCGSILLIEGIRVIHKVTLRGADEIIGFC